MPKILRFLNMNNVAVCIASGPTQSQEDIDYAKGKATVIVVNHNYRVAPWADELYAFDKRFWDNWGHEVEEYGFNGRKWTCSKWAKEYGANSLDLGFYPSSSHGAIMLAHKLGHKTVLLIGYTMGFHDGNMHRWIKNFTPRHNWKNFIIKFKWLTKEMNQWGTEIINCTPNSHLHLPYTNIKDIL